MKANESARVSPRLSASCRHSNSSVVFATAKFRTLPQNIHHTQCGVLTAPCTKSRAPVTLSPARLRETAKTTPPRRLFRLWRQSMDSWGLDPLFWAHSKLFVRDVHALREAQGLVSEQRRECDPCQVYSSFAHIRWCGWRCAASSPRWTRSPSLWSMQVRASCACRARARVRPGERCRRLREMWL